jgi:hypothetical protein
LAYLLDNPSVKLDEQHLVIRALERNRLRCLQLLHTRGVLRRCFIETSLAAAVRIAAAAPDPVVVLWLVDTVTADLDGGQGPAKAVASRSQAAQQPKRHLSANLFAAAAHHGHLPLLKLLRWGGVAAREAPARNVQMPCQASALLQSAPKLMLSMHACRARGCPWDVSAVENAIFSGCVEAVEWLKAEGCPMPVCVLS